jgi:putative tryptophan/tyrosine transport system substrate-binding protein
MAIGRRQFISALGGTAVVWPLAARAQQRAMPVVGFLDSTTSSNQSDRLVPFRQRLRELGWNEGRNIAIEVRWIEGRNERSAEIAAEFVRRKVDVIVATGTPTTVAAKQATSIVPIVFVGTADPVGTGLVPSLARPGGNVTGLSNQTRDLAGKRIELLREVIPGLRTLATMANVENVSVALELRDQLAAARALGVEVVTVEIRKAEDIAPAIMEAVKARADALSVLLDGLTISNHSRINMLALDARLPTIHADRDQLEGGGLMSYGAYQADLFRRAAEIVDKILRGTKPGDIPVEQPTKFALVISLKTARALGLSVPQMLLATADEVIE